MLKSFDIAIQLGAICAVVFLYRPVIFNRNTKIWIQILAAFIPTAIIGALFHSIVKTYLLGNSTVVLASLLIGGIVMIVFEKISPNDQKHIESLEAISVKKAMVIGLCQSVAIIPGVSRSAATIIGGMLLGVRRKTIVDFSFLLAIPTMTAATVLDLLKSYQAFNAQDVLVLCIGFIAAFLTACVAIQWLLRFIQKHTFSIFGWYRIVVVIAFWLLLSPY